MNTSNLALLSGLPSARRNRLAHWLEEFPQVAKPIQASLAAVAQRIGASLGTTRRRYDAWRNGGEAALFAAEGGTAKGPALPAAFIEYWQARCERNQRKCRPAYRALLRAWHAGEPVPGYETDPTPRAELPRGWSYANLMRHRPCDRDLALMRVGRAAAAPYLPKVYTTRKGLEPGSHYMFDDVWHDNFVLFGGKLVRVLQLTALDVASGCLFTYATMPRLRREDGTEMGIPKKLMRMLLAVALTEYGYRASGTELMAEHGTAAIDAALEELLLRRTGEKVRVRRSGITGEEQAVAGMFHGRGRGNPRFKGALESTFNLLHNELGSLPGQTGLSVDRRPEELHGLLTYETALARAGAVAGADVAARLEHPLLDYHAAFLGRLAAAIGLINDASEHDLEGWAECGHVAAEYRLGPGQPWLGQASLERLPEASRQALLQSARLDPACLRQRRLSRREVWDAGRGKLVKLPAWVAAEILGPEFARELRCERGYFEFADREYAPDGLRYESRVRTDDGQEVELKPGTYVCYANPFALRRLLVTDGAGRFLGTAARDERVSRADAEALERRFGRVAKREKDMLAGLGRRHASLTRQRIALAQHNTRLLAGAGGGDHSADTDTPASMAAVDPGRAGGGDHSADTGTPARLESVDELLEALV